MPDPTEAQIEFLLDEMTRDRGYVINSFAQVEFLLADLIDQCRSFDEYRDGGKIPFGIDKRVARLRKMMVAGPLAQFADRIEPLLVRFLEFEDVRHLMTHAHSSLLFDGKGDAGILMVQYVPPKGDGDWTILRQLYRPDTIRRQRDSSSEFTTRAMMEFREIYIALGLDPDRKSKQAHELGPE